MFTWGATANLCNEQIEPCRYYVGPKARMCVACANDQADACQWIGLRMLKLSKTGEVVDYNFKRYRHKPINYESEKDISGDYTLTVSEAKETVRYAYPVMRRILAEEVHFLKDGWKEDEDCDMIISNEERGKYIENNMEFVQLEISLVKK